jgi:hypothetical protein
MSLSERLLAYLKRQKRSHHWFAEQVYLSTSAIFHITRGHLDKISTERQQFISDYLTELEKQEQGVLTPKTIGMKGKNRFDRPPDDVILEIRRLYWQVPEIKKSPTKIKKQLNLGQTPQAIGDIARGKAYPEVGGIPKEGE